MSKRLRRKYGNISDRRTVITNGIVHSEELSSYKREIDGLNSEFSMMRTNRGYRSVSVNRYGMLVNRCDGYNLNRKKRYLT